MKVKACLIVWVAVWLCSLHHMTFVVGQAQETTTVDQDKENACGGPGWMEYEDQCFHNSQDVLSYDSCKAYCQEMGADLPCVYDQNMNYFLSFMFGTTWVGLQDDKGNGIFIWDDVRCTSDFSYWQPRHQPGGGPRGVVNTLTDSSLPTAGGGDTRALQKTSKKSSSYRPTQCAYIQSNQVNGAPIWSEESVKNAVHFWSDVGCEDNTMNSCTCQKPQPAKTMPRGDCFDVNNQVSYLTCFPFKCDGLHGGLDTCWDSKLKKHQVEYEYLLQEMEMNVGQHEEHAAEWNGHLVSVHSDAEADQLLVSVSYGDSIFFSSPESMSHDECQRYCDSQEAHQPCAPGSNTAFNGFLASNFPGSWGGYSDRNNHNKYDHTNLYCPSLSTCSYPVYKRVCVSHFIVCWKYETRRVGTRNAACDRAGREISVASGGDCLYLQNDGRYKPSSCQSKRKCTCQVESTCSSVLTGLQVEANTTSLSWADGSRVDYDLNWVDEDGPEEYDQLTVGLFQSSKHWTNLPESTTECGVYKREKQLLSIALETSGRSILLVPAVSHFENSLDVGKHTRSSRVPGTYTTDSNNTALSLTGTVTTVFLVKSFTRPYEGIQTVRQLSFDFMPPGVEECLTKICFDGVCQQLDVEGRVRIVHEGSPLAESLPRDLLTLSQHCDEFDRTSTAVLSNMVVDFLECPPNSHKVFEDTSVVPRCFCDTGYRETMLDTEEVSIIDGTCTRVATLEMEAGATYIKAFIDNVDAARFDHVHNFLVEMKKQIGRSEIVSAYPGDGAVLDRLNPSISLTGVQPGRWHLVNMIPRNSDDETVKIDGDITKVSGEVLSHCSCTNTWASGADVTGKPREFNITQEQGYVMFSFQDDSRCEDSYAFTREQSASSSDDDRAKRSFTPNYYFYSRSPCAQNRVEPGRQTSDDLRVSNLPVGDEFTYCVRATARDYMHNPEGPHMPSLSSSNEECATHRIHWEASVRGKVTLEQTAGSLPVDNVLVEWQLLEVDSTSILKSGSTLTGAGGDFDIAFNEPFDLVDNRQEFPVKLFFAKQTVSGNETINHTFACNDGTVDCGNDGAVIHIRHLTFDAPVRAVDTTSVLFSGKVVVGDTDGPESGDGCPVIGAEVCLIDKNVLNKEIGELCTKTDSEGKYRLGAVIGTRVGVEIRHHEHTFMRLNEDDTNLDRDGIIIEPLGVYQNNDFKDTTQTDLIVDVAGGLCDRTLGSSTIKVMVSGGCEWETTYHQGGFRGKHRVPAALLDIRVADVVDEITGSIGPIREFFNDPAAPVVETIDLRDMDKEEEFLDQQRNATLPRASSPDYSSQEADLVDTEEDQTQGEEEDQARRVRFQYDGTLEVSLTVPGDLVDGKGTSCNLNNYQVEDYEKGVLSFDNTKDCDSLHVIRAGVRVDLSLLLKYKLKDGLYCDIVGDNLSRNVISSLGPTAEQKDAWEVYPKLSQRDKDLLDDCNDASGGCEPILLHDVVSTNTTIVRSRARLEAVLVAGPPNISPDFLRTVSFNVGGINHMACFLIVGDFSWGELDSFALPTYEPILVLRDPPGGLSYASYENVLTSIKVESSSHETYAGFDLGLNLGITSNAGIDICTGGGFGALFLACADPVTDTEGQSLIETKTKKDYVSDFGQDKYKSQFSTTWSYKTSTDAYVAGRASDVFVVPNINVRFKDVTDIQWNSTSCQATSVRSQKFEIGAKDNIPALSFVTVTTIENSLIPKLDDGIRLLDPTDKNFDNKKQELEKAKVSWLDFLHDYERTNKLAEDGELASMPSNWFDSTTNNPITKQSEGDRTVQPPEHWGGLMPLNLVKQGRSIATGVVDPGENMNDLETTNRLHFSGEGGTLSFSMKYNSMVNHVKKMGSAPQNSKQDFMLTPTFGFKFAAFAGSTVQIKPGFHHANSRTHHQSDQSETDTKVSFVLGDDDIYRTDEFVVDVFTDPTYGTYVFRTVGGTSRCPHEDGTLFGALPVIELLKRPARPILPDEPMIFEVRLANEGEHKSRFQMLVDNADNMDMLGITSMGGTLAAPRVFELDSREEIITTVTVKRGPVAYEYPPVNLIMRDQCELSFLSTPFNTTLANFGTEADGDLRIEFARPCPLVHWSSDLRRDQEFFLNVESGDELPVTVFNPSSSLSTFAEMVSNTRLQSVLLKYRRIGDVQWKSALTLQDDGELVEIDFSAREDAEDSYGFATLPWSFAESGIHDGNYELRVETVCQPIAGASDDFNGYKTNTIPGMIDRSPPAQFGAVMPTSPLTPGQEVTIRFTEEIQCAKPFRFDLEVSLGESNNIFQDKIFTEDNLRVLCDDNRISFAFDPSTIDLAHLSGTSLHLTLDGVTDLSGNSMEVPIKYSTTHIDVNLDHASVAYVMRMKGMNCPDPAADDPTDQAEYTSQIRTEVAAMLDLSDDSRISIDSVICVVDKAPNRQSPRVTVTILPASSDAGQDRRLTKHNDRQHAQNLYRLLHAQQGPHNFTTDVSDFRLHGIPVPPSDFSVEQPLVASTSNAGDVLSHMQEQMQSLQTQHEHEILSIQQELQEMNVTLQTIFVSCTIPLLTLLVVAVLVLIVVLLQKRPHHAMMDASTSVSSHAQHNIAA